MEFILTMIMCSGAANSCLPPFTMPTTYPTIYECMVDGYATSQQKMIEIVGSCIDKTLKEYSEKPCDLSEKNTRMDIAMDTLDKILLILKFMIK